MLYSTDTVNIYDTVWIYDVTENIWITAANHIANMYRWKMRQGIG